MSQLTLTIVIFNLGFISGLGVAHLMNLEIRKIIAKRFDK